MNGEPALWSSTACGAWHAYLEAYPAVVAAQGDAKLTALDTWYRTELPEAIHGRQPPAISHAELVRLTEWKMRRGEWRPRNLFLVQGNPEAEVERAAAEAFAAAPDPLAPVRRLAKLGGVGP